MAKTPSKNPLKHLKAADLRGVAQLATQATSGVTRIAEGVHQSVWRTMGVTGGKESGQTGGITGLVYQSIQGVTQLVGKGLDGLLAKLEPWLESVVNGDAATPEREAVLAALNGVIGDRLVTSGNPLATPMSLRYQGAALDWQALPSMPEATGKIVLLIHGLCMNDLQWQPSGATLAGNHGATLAAALGYTPIYVRYNTGLHTAENGHQLARLLEQLVTHWPTPIGEITVVAHSMGGLVTRSAVHSAKHSGLRWPATLKNIVFLGTPHHGAPLERAGNWVDVMLGSTPYSAPFAKLGQLRSTGITDLRFGLALPLPEGVACYTVAATTAAKRSALADRLIGDGLVPLHSALGQHDDPQRSLIFAKPSQWIAYRMNHMEMLTSPAVTQQLLNWLTPQEN